MASKAPNRRTIALGVTGGVACYKAAEILRRLQDRGFDVFVVMTANSAQFVTPLTFRALSGNPVFIDMFGSGGPGEQSGEPFDHIFRAESADLFLVAPATANALARMASGAADDFFSTFHLAVTAPVIVAPAMNTRMWEHPAVRENLKRLKARGVRVIDPGVGRMACETIGPGRLADVGTIVSEVSALLERGRDLAGRRVLVTAGPTVEDIDPVRYISNRSSGKMGYALARAARDRGADVTLVSGPGNLDFPDVIRVRTTSEMRDAVLARLAGVDVVVKAAAPLDFQIRNRSAEKIRKEEGLALEFEPAPDILHEIGLAKNGTLLIGFAAETQDHVESGIRKLRSKNLDLIVVNPVEGPDTAFDSDMNQAIVISAAGDRDELPRMSKHEMSHRILDRVLQLLEQGPEAAHQEP